MGNHKRKRKQLGQRTFPYAKRLYLPLHGMWVIWLWGKEKKTKKEEKKSHE